VSVGSFGSHLRCMPDHCLEKMVFLRSPDKNIPFIPLLPLTFLRLSAQHFCQVGYSGPDGGPCVACLPGAYKNVNGSSACSACPSLSFQNFSGQSACGACPERMESSAGSALCR